ncbi:MAG: DNA-binding response regulator [candidate division NC10 bacterium RIFCSPLOWO2_12_FULL_66_18]|nr:MAG: DNA-binding response regulator [candidate division NC10 bacterium RIFCSPLOWO2_02_FULL_66_22]OGB96775.1 MAG: DNA-binding response regulator [candidate division NC10 bacterium RIFCSPLOWO2_12_FULL_66_18]
MPISLVLADDHPIILDGLEMLFRAEQDFQVLARCVNGEETIQAVRQHRPDILILDIRMPGKDGLAVLREVKKDSLPTRAVLLTVGLDEDDLLEAIRLGVRGVVLKEMAPQMLVQCVRKVHAGEQWLEKRSVGRALEKMLLREAGERQVAGVLTPRELEIVRMVAAGLRNKEIAESLSISEGTVKIHLHHIYEKLHLGGRLELALYAQERGLV